MKVWYDIIIHVPKVFLGINFLELLAGILLLFPSKKSWREYLVVFYGGFLFGMLPFFLISEDLVITLAACICLSCTCIFLHYRHKDQGILPVIVVCFKVILILGVTLLQDYYLENKVEFYFICMLLSMIISGMVLMFFDLASERWMQIICPVFGILEISGAMLQFYRIDYLAFAKDFFSVRESVPFFLYLLKCDFWIFDYQTLFLAFILVLLMLYGVGGLLLSRWRRWVEK